MSKFEWPWQYEFPPFFTLQCNADTKAKQIETWCELLLAYCRHHKLFRLQINDMLISPLFYNQKINRKFSAENVLEILDVLKKKGNVEWDDKNKTSCVVLWRTVTQWSDIIYTWAAKAGYINTVCTLHEITQGINTTQEEFHGLEDWLLLRTLRLLESKGKAELIGEEGVKFF
ncbi:vacuolar protein-sorting-associated protein 25-like [Clavelina lepadiformis]|uniref:vacuolar protein-sorting-associated protein 25-like n=1 Tax=Clavelina lepadiformis TaxID=159417 RepID=UPI00404267E8